MRIVDGRGLRAADRDGATRVAVVNETFARTVWPGRSAVGQRLLHQERDGVETPLEVVGVAADAKYRYISDAPEPFLFVPMAQHPIGDVTLFVGHAPGAAPDAALRAAVAQVEPSVPVMFVQSFDDAVAIGLTPQRLTAWVAGSVGLAGVGLAALGLYGLMAFLVAQRTRETRHPHGAGRIGGPAAGPGPRTGGASGRRRRRRRPAAGRRSRRRCYGRCWSASLSSTCRARAGPPCSSWRCWRRRVGSRRGARPQPIPRARCAPSNRPLAGRIDGA